LILEDHPVDDGVLHHGDDQVAVLEVDLHVGEEVGPEQGLKRQVDPLRVHRLAGLDRQVGDDRRLFDALVPLHEDALHDPALLGRRLGECEGRDSEGRRAQKQGKAGG
jgi:hypothetical protein